MKIGFRKTPHEGSDWPILHSRGKKNMSRGKPRTNMSTIVLNFIFLGDSASLGEETG